MSQYFWSPAEPCSKTQTKAWDAALIVKLEKRFDGDTRLFAQQELIAIAGLYLCTDTQKVSSHAFSPKSNSPYSTVEVVFNFPPLGGSWMVGSGDGAG